MADGSTAAAGTRGTGRDVDALIIGAGFAGMYQLHSLRDRLGLDALVLEAGDGVGGTWYWNRYPGARCDSESHSYAYYFSKALLDGWEWSERYPGQAEILRYLNSCADQTGPQARHPVRRPRALGPLRRGREPLARRDRGRRALQRDMARSPRSAACPRRTCPRSRASPISAASGTTPASGRMTASTSPESASARSAPARPASRRRR